ncbi:phosphoribosylglycinamide synthetase [Gardnerella vaginalis]|uniref:phosphoribosylglycinamide synthetase n=1 Tax=Gardnerella vaginalis TaxID=2702 RepID=UPI0039F0F1D6
MVNMDEKSSCLTPLEALDVAAERLSIVRYVFLVQIEDGIPTASQRSSLEYADAVLMGWPEGSDDDVVMPPDDSQMQEVYTAMRSMEDDIASFSDFERAGDVDRMTDTLVNVTNSVAKIRGIFQPSFPLPTFSEIERVVTDEWNEEMGNIDPNSANAASEVIDESRLEEKEDKSHES